jgi:hypothetical protein
VTPAALGRAIAAVRVAYGGVLLLAPPAGNAMIVRTPPDHIETVVGRVLGARHLVQGLAEWSAPRRVGRLGLLVDGAHATSMVGWAVLDRRHRRTAVLSAAAAALFTVAELGATRR